MSLPLIYDTTFGPNNDGKVELYDSSDSVLNLAFDNDNNIYKGTIYVDPIDLTSTNTNLNNIARGYIAAGNEIDGATVIIESNASIKGKSNAIMGRETNNLTITNSGTISASTSKAINLRDAQNTTITNKKGATIAANTNAIVQEAAGTENAENVTISNSGTISSCLLYTSPSPRDRTRSRMPSSA